MIKVRFAPSPTGHLHIGGLRGALFNYYFAKQNNGKFLIRIEDTDIERNKQEYTDAILTAFAWCNIASDEPIICQSERMAIYQKYIKILLANGNAYYSQEQDENGNIGNVIKCKVNKNQHSISFCDIIRGKISFPISEIDDFIIVRSNGVPLYNLVVVVDDIEMGISHIIRGEEHLSNTPKQIILYQALGKNIPTFAHLPLILGSDRKKLSKRDAATAVIDYKKEGFLADALCMYLLRLGWAYGDQEIFSYEEILSYFKLENVHLSGAIFDIQKLKSINHIFLKKLPPEKLLTLIKNEYSISCSDQIACAIIVLYLPRSQTLKELITAIDQIISRPAYTNANIQGQNSIDHTTLLHIRDCILGEFKINREISWNDILKYQSLSVYSKHTLYTALRFLILGITESPSILTIMDILGKEEVIKRIEEYK